MLTQSAIYALRAMVFLASQHSEKPVLAKTVSEEMGIPRQYLSRILHTLVLQGYLTSVRGKNGGYLLAKPSSEISLREVAALFMDFNNFKKCFLGLPVCGTLQTCKIHHKWQPLVQGLEILLNETTIDQVLWPNQKIKANI